jgi:hypothetical protein
MAGSGPLPLALWGLILPVVQQLSGSLCRLPFPATCAGRASTWLAPGQARKHTGATPLTRNALQPECFGFRIFQIL